MAYTQADLVREVIAELARLDTGQTPAAEDVARVEFSIPAILAEMSGLNIIYIADGNSVSDAAFRSVVTYIAQSIAPDFLLPVDEERKQRAEKRLRALQRLGKGAGVDLKTPEILRQGITRRSGFIL